MLEWLQYNEYQVSISNFNNDFLLLRSDSSKCLRALGKAIFKARFHFVEEVIVTEAEICVKLNPLFKGEHIALFQQLETEEGHTPKTHQLPVFFDTHPDWEAVTGYTKLGKEKIIDSLTNTAFTVGMFGFLPGFVYMNGLEPSLHVPRKTIPSKYVEANSIAIGGKYLGIYAVDSPGGWHVIGKTPSTLLTNSLPPTLVDLDDRIQLLSISQEEFEQIR